jgi:N-acetylmuramoyl-L-alanine amidase
MAKLQLLCIHCTATPEGMVVYPDDIRRWHLSPPPQGRGWKQVGYSDMIMLNGMPVKLVKYNDDDEVDPWEITNGAVGINRISRHIVYVGGVDKSGKPKDTRTGSQLETMRSYVKTFLSKHPDARVCGHNQFAPKACPSFDVPAWLRSIGIPEKNIYEKER